MSKKKPSVAIVGAGMGGLAVAATLRKVGIDVQVYEQAARFARIGAGIQMLPNSMKVLRGIGIEDKLRSFSFAPQTHLIARLLHLHAWEAQDLVQDDALGVEVLRVLPVM